MCVWVRHFRVLPTCGIYGYCFILITPDVLFTLEGWWQWGYVSYCLVLPRPQMDHLEDPIQVRGENKGLIWIHVVCRCHLYTGICECTLKFKKSICNELARFRANVLFIKRNFSKKCVVCKFVSRWNNESIHLLS